MIHNRACSHCGQQCFLKIEPINLADLTAPPAYVACSNACAEACDARIAHGETLPTTCLCGADYADGQCSSPEARRIFGEWMANRLAHGKPMNLGGVRSDD